MLLVLYSFLLTLLLALTAPWWLWQMVRTGKYREGFTERLGLVPARLARTAAGPSIWLHAVSVGEVLAASRLVSELGRALPNTTIYISTTTRTGQALARERFGAHRVFYFPLDFAFAMRAWVRYLRPCLVVLLESEFWPRMLLECRRAAIPVAVVNARISDRSWPRYRRLRALWQPLLASLPLVLAQSEQDAERLRYLGAWSAKAAGNLKYDIRVARAAPITAALRAQLSPAIPIVVCGSTLAGEEELLLAALPLSQTVTILAPRHPERFDEVARLLTARNLPFMRRSTWPPAGPPGSGASALTLVPGTVLLLDSVGELASVYSLATLAILGGGFLHAGGHNPLEPAQFAVPVVMGIQYANFRQVVEALLADKAVVLADAAGLEAACAQLLSDPEALRRMGERALRVFESQAGATDLAVRKLATLVAPPSHPVDPACSPGTDPQAIQHHQEVPR